MLYASEIARCDGHRQVAAETNDEELPDLVARLLAQTVRLRLRRNLTLDYRDRRAVTSRVRGQIDMLKTESERLLARGRVACRYQELVIDTPRNRLVRFALETASRIVTNQLLAAECRSLAHTFALGGVNSGRPSRSEISADQIGRNDSDDRYMVALAQLALDLALPSEDAGRTALPAPVREEHWVRQLFEKAVLGFARLEYGGTGWRVSGGEQLRWPVESCSPGLDAILPKMVTDVVIEGPGQRRLVIDTKFTSILQANRFGGTRLKSHYLYQIYAYLRTQADDLPGSSALLLHPATGLHVLEYATIQGHRVTFATLDLAAPPRQVGEQLRRILQTAIGE